MKTETRLNKLEAAVQAIPRTLDQLRREYARMQSPGFDPCGKLYEGWLGEMSDDELEAFSADITTPEQREYYASLTEEELERACTGDYAPLESRQG